MDNIIDLGQQQMADEVILMKDIVRISVEVAAGLRRSMSKNGIRQIADFVNGMAFAGLLLQKNYRTQDGPTSFVETFEKKLRTYTELMSGDKYSDVRGEMMVHQLGVTDQSPTEMLVTAGLSAQDTIATIGEEYNLSAQDVMDMVTIVIALVIAASTPKEKRQMIMDGMVQGVIEKSRVWDQLIPSDDELFGDEDDI
jgi:hypothetical protein